MGYQRMGSSVRGRGNETAGCGGTERKKYPIRAADYELYEEIGQGVTADVYRAKCIPFNEIVAVKILDLEKSRNSDLSNISREAQTMVLVNHPNLLKAHCSFACDQTLWVVMPYMEGGSCLNIMKSAYPEGFEELIIATILREVLKGLEYLHTQGHIHRDVKAGNILLGTSAGVKLGDFGVSACLYDSGDRQRVRNTFVGTPCWMAPEVMEQLHGYDFKADIWSFGITALELAHGHAPFSKYPPMKVLLMTMQNAPPSLNYERDKKYTKNFRHMIALCLLKDPSRRPTARKLLKHNFFKQARSNEYLNRNLLDCLPPLADRIRALKVKEQDMLDQKKMPDGIKEELSQKEYNKGITCWNFDINDLKDQSSLVQDDDFMDVKYICGSANSIFELGSLQLNRSPSISSASSSSRDEPDGDNELMQDKATTYATLDLLSASQSGLPQVPSQDGEVCNETCPATPDGSLSETISRAHRTAEEIDAKSKVPLIHQKGRFQVTSENIELKKVPPSPSVPKTQSFQVPPSLSIPKSQSFQAISQTPPSNSSSSLPPNLLGGTLFQHLQYFLKDNVINRDYILNAMAQVVAAPVNQENDDVSIKSAANATEKPLLLQLELAIEREKELIQQVADLERRVLCAEEELQKLKTKSP